MESNSCFNGLKGVMEGLEMLCVRRECLGGRHEGAYSKATFQIIGSPFARLGGSVQNSF